MKEARWSGAAVLLLAGVAAASLQAGRAVMSCQRRYYRTRAEQLDSAGRRCWGDITIKSCRGRCDSHEVPDWEFPYKKSHHPVCVHGARKPVPILLRYCDPGVAPGTNLYYYMEAMNCKCQRCSSDDTSCEWLPPNSSELEKFVEPAMSDPAEPPAQSMDDDQELD